MKAEINSDGHMTIKSESDLESFALKMFMSKIPSIDLNMNLTLDATFDSRIVNNNQPKNSDTK